MLAFQNYLQGEVGKYSIDLKQVSIKNDRT